MPGTTVRLVGTLGVRRAGSDAVETGLGSRKARSLLARLAVADGRIVPLDALIEALWPAAAPQRPADNVATLVSRIRALLGPEVILGSRGGYAIGPDVGTDLREAAALVAAGGLARARAALDLLEPGAVLLGEPDADWVAAARADGERLLRAARHAACRAALQAGDPGAAVAVARAAADADRLDEESHRLLMNALAAAGEPAAALAVHAALRAALADELGVDPAPATQAVHRALLREPAGSRHAAPAGRDGELEILTDSWTAACAGRGGLVLLAGEAGIGKTRLAEALTEHVRGGGATVLGARCYAAERSLFLQPLVDALMPALAGLPEDDVRDLAGAHAPGLADLLPDLAATLGPPPAERGSAESEWGRTVAAVGHVLRGLAATAPVLVVLDDLQNAGLATHALLHPVIRRLAGQRVLVVATVRAEEGEAALDALADVALRVDVGPLDAAAVTALATAAGRADLAGDILRRTRGHTLFVVETLRGLRAGEGAVPASLQAAVLARVRRAGDETGELLRAGAVLGAAVDPATVAAMLDVPEPVALRRCERAAAARLLVEAGRSYEFANDLVQEVLYATTPEPVRVAFHRRAADLSTSSPEAVARHAEAAGDRARAARALLLAGDRAVRRQAVADAEALFDRALRLADAPELTARAHLARGQAREALGRFGPAEADQHAALAAAREAGDRRVEMLALRALGGHASLARGVPIEVCVGRLRAGLSIAESLGDRDAQAVLESWLAVLATNRLRFAEGLERSGRALRVAGTGQGRVVALDARKNAHAYLGELEPLAGVLDELVPLLRRAGHLELLQWAVFESAFAPVAAGDWDGAVDRVREALAINERSGYPVHRPWFVAHLGWIARLRGRLDEAEEHERRAAELAAHLPHRWFLQQARAALAVTLLERGDAAQAADLLAGGIADDAAEAHRLRFLAPLAEATGDPATLRTADALLAAIDAPPGTAWLPGADAYLAVARAWLAQGEPGRAREVVAPLRAAARRLGWRPVAAQAALEEGRAAAALGDPDAGALLAGAAADAAALGMAGVAARAQTSSASSRAARRAPSRGTGR